MNLTPNLMQSEVLIDDLLRKTAEISRAAEQLKAEAPAALTWRPAPDAWNVLECLAHLNLYGDYYLPEIKCAINQSSTSPDPTFKSGLLGGYFAKSMLPKEKLNKMKTFKDKNPLNSALDLSEIDRFIDQQAALSALLRSARNVSLNKVKVKISITNLIRLRLGDTFLFYINHMMRHIKQIEKIKDQREAII